VRTTWNGTVVQYWASARIKAGRPHRRPFFPASDGSLPSLPDASVTLTHVPDSPGRRTRDAARRGRTSLSRLPPAPPRVARAPRRRCIVPAVAHRWRQPGFPSPAWYGARSWRSLT